MNWSELKIPTSRLLTLSWLVLIGMNPPLRAVESNPQLPVSDGCGQGLASAAPSRRILALSSDPQFLSNIEGVLARNSWAWNVSWVGNVDDLVTETAVQTWDVVVVEWDRDPHLGAVAIQSLVSAAPNIPMVLVSNNPSVRGLITLFRREQVAIVDPGQLSALPPILHTLTAPPATGTPSIERSRRFRKYLKAFGGLAHNPNVHFFVKDGMGRYLEFNQTFATAFGITDASAQYSDERLIPAALGHRLRGDILNSLRAGDLEVITRLKMCVSVERFALANGSVHPFFVLKFPISISKEEIVVGGIAIDVSNMNEPMLPFVPHLAIRLTFDGTIREWNRTAEKLLGFSVEEALGENFERLLSAKRGTRGGLAEVLAECRASTRWQGRLQVNSKDGTSRTIETSWTVVETPNVGTRTLHIVGHDVTDRVLYENELERLGRLELAQMITDGVAHDFNNLLVPILGYLEILQTGNNHSPDFVQTALREMWGAAGRASKLVQGLKRVSQGKINEFRPIDMNQWLPQAVEAVTQTVHPVRSGVELDFQKPDEVLWNVYGDPDALITQVLLNLSINAVHAMKSGGRLIISARNTQVDELYAHRHPEALPGPHVVISVIDNGIGMNEDTLSRIFVPYFTTKGKDGSGMGLFNVNRIVQLHGGFIVVYSQEGQGTHFAIHLPAVRSSQTSEESGIPMGHNELVLVVEDDADLANYAKVILEGGGYRVVVLPNGVEALRFFDVHGSQVRAILLDMIMPAMGGQEVVRRLVERDPSLNSRVIASSGFTQSMILPKDLLPYAFLQKPFNGLELLRHVHGAIHHSLEQTCTVNE